MSENRHTDPTPIMCDDCKWRGTVAECIHTYRGYGGELPDGTVEADVEPIDLCPVCRGENLIKILPDCAQLELVPV